MEKERIWTLLARRLAEEASEEDLLELHGLLSDRDELLLCLQILASFRAPDVAEINGFPDEEAYLRLQRRLSELDPDFGKLPENGFRQRPDN